MKKIFTRLSGGAFVFFLILGSVFAQQNISIRGRVTDAKSGEALIGVSVKVKGTTQGTSTDVNGGFTISAPGTGILVVSYIGYQSQEVAINNQPTINIKLQASSQSLNEVIVVGYGTQRKIDVTGSISQVKGADVNKQPASDAASALQGKVAGVTITNSGAPGATPKVIVRGVGTIYGNTNLLYVIDGVWYDNMSFINPADIENISVLKDASAQSIYGIRAANGVILVTTKKGSKGRTVVDYNGYVGFQNVTNQVEMANGTEYATLINELTSSSGGTPIFSNPSSFGTGTNWYNEILRRAFVTSHQLSVNGGGEKSTYNFSFGYLNQDGLVKGNNYQRYTARFNNEYEVAKFLKVGFNITATDSVSRDVPSDIWHQIYSAAPIVAPYNSDGSFGDPYNISNGALGSSVQFNPLATLEAYNQKAKRYRFTGNAYANVSLTKDLTFKTSLGGEFGQYENRNYVGVYNYTKNQVNNVSKLSIGRADTRNWIIENTLTYNKKFTDHSLTVLLGQSAQRYKLYGSTASGEGVPYSSEGDLYLKLASASSYNYKDDGKLTTVASYFGRVNYSFKDKYLLNASLRADGASQFYNGGDLWGYFPSVGLGWIVTNEGFMKDQQIFDNLKIRGSWGKIGNAGVPYNPTILTVTATPQLSAIFGPDQKLYPGASIDVYPAAFLNWERVAGTNIGFEAAFLTNRLNIEADYYSKTTQQTIFAIPVLSSIGLKSDGGTKRVANQADFRNRGAELSITWRDKTSGGLTYSVGGNISMNNNKVTKVLSGNTPLLTGGTGITNGASVTRTVQGRPIGEFFGYQVAGIFQDATEVSGSAQPGAKPGDFRYVDQNGDNVIDGKDRVSLGNPFPKYNYGINTSFEYKNFDLAIDFQGAADVDVYNANIAYRYGNENFTKDFFDNRWHGEGTSTTYPSVAVGSTSNSAPNSFYVESGSYFRVRNLQLGYTLPKSILSKWKVNRVRVYANAQNMINIFGYKGFSPEVYGASILTSGVDANVYPLYATYNFGVNLTF
ncbi:SusC/RagA family TonB-linked outer membrane protein [Pararcticibacter amylolyticus]|uniref:SusC/RagA family TonB-linked outer membrane protein n=1 Tax=Pararcticibacter amylolyticus TaxID=2173175 RepID=A0A2U2PFH1_9SPHI|nr:TonB-dependent receptor [Pararcticibacter amylolyticus]PWG79879.1 SusC/RagA family TonB-linked outer membrane protein [Pararcticibacter amylolyticus]